MSQVGSRCHYDTLPAQRTPLPAANPPTHAAEAPRGLGVLSGRPPGRPKQSHRRMDGPRGPARLGQGNRGVPQRGTSLARPLSIGPAGTGGFTRPRHPQGQEDQDRSGGPPACPPARRDTPTGTQARPRRTTPLTDSRDKPTAPPPPTPTGATVPQHPHPAAQPRAAARTLPPHAGTTMHAEPGDMAPPTPAPRPRHPGPYPPMPQYYSHPAHAAHEAPPHHHVYHRHTDHHHQTLPAYPPAPLSHTQPTHPQHHHHTIQHHLPPPLLGLTTYGPPYTPMDPWGARQAHQQHQGLQGAPHRNQQPPHPHPMPASTFHQQPPTTYGPEPDQDAQAAASLPYLGTAASQGPQGPHGTHRQHPHDPARRPDSHPAQHPPHPPHHHQCSPPTIPTPPRDQDTDAPRGDPHQPPPPPAPADTHRRESSLPGPPRETPSPDPTRDDDDHRPPPPHITPPITPRTTSRRTGRRLYPTQPRSGMAAPPGARRPGGATPPHLRNQRAHFGGHPSPNGHPGGGRPRLPLRRLPPRRPTRPPPACHP